jgi:hypothetical protein
MQCISQIVYVGSDARGKWSDIHLTNDKKNQSVTATVVKELVHSMITEHSVSPAPNKLLYLPSQGQKTSEITLS